MGDYNKRALQFFTVVWAILSSATFLACAHADSVPELGWPKVTTGTRPWTYWWWLGSAVDKEGLTEHLEAYHKAGLGGVHIIPIYGVKGAEGRFVEYLSPKWMEMLAHTTAEAERLGMGVDMSTGTGWPFGGPDVSSEDATADVIFRTYQVNDGQRLKEAVKLEDERGRAVPKLQALTAYSDAGDIVELTAKVDEQGILDWTAPKGDWKLYAVFQGLG
ncbi:MAG: glycosyl hydrolase, partial [Planctomycetota bacterium]